jgi:hypothetical protein
MTNIIGSQRTVALMFAAALGLGAAVSGQAAQPAPARTQMDELLAEVRAIRADLDRAAATSLRGQLLGMRLQLQEQRISTIARQLSDVQQRLRDNAQTRASMLGPLKMFAGMKEPGQPEKPDEANMMKMFLGPLKEQLAALDKSDAELKAEESMLTGQLHDEQNRWTAFNAQIEEMERASAGRGR